MMCYAILIVVFTICFAVLQMEIDPEVAAAEGIGYFGKTLLQTFRTSIGELGVPAYSAIWSSRHTLHRDINIFLIWATWLTQTFFMLVIMLNFIIAIITANYEKCINYQKVIAYQHKADLNMECF